jgi:aerobic carbon-monoxide dehydrogenase medium subunit
MKSAPFEYFVPDNLEEAMSLMAEHGDECRPLAGGQSLVPMMAFRLVRPEVLVDLNRVSELTRIEFGVDRVHIGAMVRERAAERNDAVTTGVPLLGVALPLIGHEAIRTRGTIGGSLAHSDAAAELPAVAVATDATITARSERRGEREVAAEDFFVSHYTNALENDELLTGVSFPVTSRSCGVNFEEVARRHGDFAIVGVASILGISDATIREARVVLTGVADRPLRARTVEDLLVGQPAGRSFREAAEAVRDEIHPSADLHGTAEYRRHIASVLIRRSLEKARARAWEQP